jgi:phosphopantetheinyl transferase
MPIIFSKKNSNNFSVAVWQVAETEEFFFDFLKLLPEDVVRIKNCKLQKVRLQKLACRAALAELLGSQEVNITYSKTGQPQFKDSHISFSHTQNTVAVVLSKIPVGVDIEELTPRILPLYPRFMSKTEILDCDVTNLKELYYFWCSKEAMYKWFANKNLDFIKDLHVDKTQKKGIICEKSVVQLVDFSFDNLFGVVCF